MKIYGTKDRVRVEILTELEQLRAQVKALAAQGQEKTPQMADQVAKLAHLESQPHEKRVAFILGPLTVKQKAEVLGALSMKGGAMIQDKLEMARLAIKYGLKGVEGLEDQEGKPWELPVDEQGFPTDEAFDTLLNLPDISQVLISAVSQMAASGPAGKVYGVDERGVPYPLENVEVILNPKASRP